MINVRFTSSNNDVLISENYWNWVIIIRLPIQHKTYKSPCYDEMSLKVKVKEERKMWKECLGPLKFQWYFAKWRHNCFNISFFNHVNAKKIKLSKQSLCLAWRWWGYFWSISVGLSSIKIPHDYSKTKTLYIEHKTYLKKNNHCTLKQHKNLNNFCFL